MVKMLVAYRDAGFWSQLWRRLLWPLKLWPRSTLLPPQGFVGQVSLSSRGSVPVGLKRKQIQLTRGAIIDAARLWRLTCVWVTRQPAQHRPQSGTS